MFQRFDPRSPFGLLGRRSATVFLFDRPNAPCRHDAPPFATPPTFVGGPAWRCTGFSLQRRQELAFRRRIPSPVHCLGRGRRYKARVPPSIPVSRRASHAHHAQSRRRSGLLGSVTAASRAAVTDPSPLRHRVCTVHAGVQAGSADAAVCTVHTHPPQPPGSRDPSTASVPPTALPAARFDTPTAIALHDPTPATTPPPARRRHFL